MEAVANAQHQAIAVLQQITDGFLNARIAEHGSNKLATAIRLVTSAKAAGNHHDLRIIDILNHCFYGLFNSSSSQIANNKGIRLSASCLKGTRTIVFTVVAREHRDKYAGLSNIHRRSQSQLSSVERHVDISGLLYSWQAIRENLLQRLAISSQSLIRSNNSIVDSDACACSGVAQHHVVQASENYFRVHASSQLQHHATGLQGKQAFRVMEGLNELEAQLVAHSHGGYECSDTALFNSSCSLDLACFHSSVYSSQILAQCSKVQHLGIIARAGQEYHLVPCFLELSRNGLVAIDNAHSKGNQGGRNSFIHKGAAHGVLATNGRQLQSIQRSEGT